MKNLVIALYIILLGSFLYIQTEANQVDQVQNELAGIQVNSNSNDNEEKDILDYEESSSNNYSAIIEKNVIPLKIFDFFNIF